MGMSDTLKNKPILLNIQALNILIVGGGEIGYRKAKSLVDKCLNLSIVSTEFAESTSILGRTHEDKVELITMDYELYHLDHFEHYSKHHLVYACTNDEALNQLVSSHCEEVHKLCNRTDQFESGSFSDMMYHETEDYLVSVSGKGSPWSSKYLLKQIRTMIQEDLEKKLHLMKLGRKNFKAQKYRYEEIESMPSEALERLVNMETIRVGTRGSRLAKAQTNWVMDTLKSHHPHLNFEMVIISTKGDEIQTVSLDKIGDKGLFVKEIEQQLLEGKIDMAVHSMKDMPSDQGLPLAFSKSPIREDARDVLVLKDGYTSLSELPEGALIGTGSKRRLYQLLKVRPDIKAVPIRGNIETRLSKIESENLHGVVLAAAGLHRLGLKDRITEYLSHDIMIPAPAQGALAIQYHKSREDLKNILDTLADESADICVRAERAFLEGVEGSCHIPIGAHATFQSDSTTLKLDCIWGTEDGSILKKVTKIGDASEPEKLGKQCAEAIKEDVNL